MRASRLIDDLQTVEDEYHARPDRAYKTDDDREAYGAAKVWAVSPSPPIDKTAYGFSSVGLSGGDLHSWQFDLILGEVHKKLQTRTGRKTMLEFLEGRLGYLLAHLRDNATTVLGTQNRISVYPQIAWRAEVNGMIATMSVQMPRTVI